MKKDDIHIIADVLSGDTNAFSVLLHKYVRPIRSFIGRMVSSAEDAEELAQNVFVKAYKHLAEFDADKSSFASWLNRIAYHEAVDYLRRKSSVAFFSMDDADMEMGDPADEALSDAHADRVELLRRAVLELPPQDRMLLHLYYNDELPLRDIGFILDRQPDYLATRLQRIRKRLYKTIKQLEQHETK